MSVVNLKVSDGTGAMQLAKDWAIKTDGPVEGDNFSAKYYASSISVGVSGGLPIMVTSIPLAKALTGPLAPTGAVVAVSDHDNQGGIFRISATGTVDDVRIFLMDDGRYLIRESLNGGIDARGSATLQNALDAAKLSGALYLPSDKVTRVLTSGIWIGDDGGGDQEVTSIIGGGRQDTLYSFQTNDDVLIDATGGRGMKIVGLGISQETGYNTKVGYLTSRRITNQAAGLGEFSGITLGCSAELTVWYNMASDESYHESLRLDNTSTWGRHCYVTHTNNALGITSTNVDLSVDDFNNNGIKFNDCRFQFSTGWKTATSYVVGDKVLWGTYPDGIRVYTCTVNNTSDSTTEPGIGASWNTVWSQGAAVIDTVSLIDIGSVDRVTFHDCYSNTDIDYWPHIIIRSLSGGTQPENISIKNHLFHGSSRSWVEIRGTVNKLYMENCDGSDPLVAHIATDGINSARILESRIDQPTSTIDLSPANSDIIDSIVRCKVLTLSRNITRSNITVKDSLTVTTSTTSSSVIRSGGTVSLVGVTDSDILAVGDVTINNGTRVNIVSGGNVTVTNGFVGNIRTSGQVTIGSGTGNAQGRIECLSTLPPIINVATDTLEIYYYDIGQYPRIVIRSGDTTAGAFTTLARFISGSNSNNSGSEIYLKNVTNRGAKLRAGRMSEANAGFRVRIVKEDGTEIDSLEINSNGIAGDTAMLVYDVDKAALVRVSIGAIDSGGVGYKVLRVPN